jgi:phosphate-selective porin
MSGYVQTRWTDAVGTTNPLEIRRARLQMNGNLAPRVSWLVQSDLVHSPVLLDARLDYNHSRYVRLAIGQLKIPFSQENFGSERDAIAIERTLVVNNLAPGRDNGSNGRDIGGQIEGDVVRLGGRPLLTYSAALLQGAGINRRDDNRRKDIAIRLAVRPIPQLAVAGDYYDGASGDARTQRDRTAVEVAYVRGRYSLFGEYLWGRDGGVHRRGGYGLLAYRFLSRWESFVRFDRYEPTDAQRTDTYLGGLNWAVSQWVKLQANYGIINDNSRDDNTQTVLTQLQFAF